MYVGKYSSIIDVIFTLIRNHIVISTALSKMKEFSRSQAVSYTVIVAISRKRCKIETLLQFTNRK